MNSLKIGTEKQVCSECLIMLLIRENNSDADYR